MSVRHDPGWPVYELHPRAGEPVCHVLFLHGGAYIHEITFWHWSLAFGLARRTPAHVVVPIYPLGAALGAARAVAAATEIAAALIEDTGGDGAALLGDSAGGGLTLAVAQALRDQGMTPGRVVLIAPWLDAGLERSEHREIEPRDAMLAIPGLQEAGRAYAGSLPVEDPRVSPIHGDMSGLPPITIFTGTDDLLNPDSHRLAEMCADAGVPCELVEEPGMPHDHVVFPTPEGAAARRRIVELLRR